MQMEVYNSVSQLITEEYIAPFQGLVRYNVSKLPEGLYFAVFKDKKKLVGKVKFVVAR